MEAIFTIVASYVLIGAVFAWPALSAIEEIAKEAKISSNGFTVFVALTWPVWVIVFLVALLKGLSNRGDQ
jgi:hypothetical protein